MAYDREWHRRHYEKNREEIIRRVAALQKAQRQRDPEHRRRIERASYAKHREHRLALRKARREEDAFHKLRYQANYTLSNAIRDARFPRAADYPCSRCGELAVNWHHHRGYEREFWLDVVAVCFNCHAYYDGEARRQRKTLLPQSDSASPER